MVMLKFFNYIRPQLSKRLLGGLREIAAFTLSLDKSFERCCRAKHYNYSFPETMRSSQGARALALPQHSRLSQLCLPQASLPAPSVSLPLLLLPHGQLCGLSCSWGLEECVPFYCTRKPSGGLQLHVHNHQIGLNWDLCHCTYGHGAWEEIKGTFCTPSVLMC